MKLSDFIRANIEPIIDTWVQFAMGISVARHMNVDALRDHASEILCAIADDLDTLQTAYEQEEKSKGRGPRSAKETYAALHGAARESSGFDVIEVISEFRALRASIIRLWSVSNRTVPKNHSDELTRFNEAIDQALMESVERYTADMVVDLERYTHLFDTLLSSSPDLNFIFDVDGKFIYANQAFANRSNKSTSEILGRNLVDLDVYNASVLQQELRHVIDTGVAYRGEMPVTLAPGKEGIYEYVFVPVMDAAGNVEAIVGMARDLTERKAAEEQIRRNANYDTLTGLPNRSLFRNQLEREVKRSVRTGLPFALFFIDLDGFKEVNDQLGHAAGDLLLQQAAERISSCVRNTDMVARLGGDEFTVILTEINKITHVEILAEEILKKLVAPFLILQKDVHISGSIGITLFPQDASTPENLVRNADQAMYVAKKAGRNRFSFFTISMRESAWARLKVIGELRHALPEHQLAVYYQPIVDLSVEAIVKAEALLRWHHPQSGLMHPEEFIGLAEETGLIGEIGDWVLGEAMMRAREWSALLGAPFQISVNKSPAELMSKKPMKNWEAHLAAFGSAKDCIAVEITEGVLLIDSPSVREKLDNLQKAGIQLAIDDFGTGYSSMAYLKKFEVDYLKIDQSFVRDMTINRDSRTIAETIIVMAHKLGLKVIAEGVETAEQRDCLKAAQCDYAQGYLFSEPVSSQDFEKLLCCDKAQYQASV